MDAVEDRCLVYLVCFVYLVHLVSFWIFSFNQTNEINQTNQINERGQINLSLSDRQKVANDDLGNFLKVAVRCQDRKPMLDGGKSRRSARMPRPEERGSLLQGQF